MQDKTKQPRIRRGTEHSNANYGPVGFSFYFFRIIFYKLSLLSLSPFAYGEPLNMNEFTTIEVNNMESLLVKGCDPSSTTSTLACRWQAHLFCMDKGYAGGFGPTDVNARSAKITCAPKSLAMLLKVPYSGRCTQRSSSHIACDSLARRQCIDRGYETGSAVIGANHKEIMALCLPKSSAQNLTTSLPAIQQAKQGGHCNTQTLVAAQNGCFHHAHALCKAKGYATSYGITEYAARTGEANITCIKHTHFITPFFPDNVGRPQRSFKLGTNYAGTKSQNSAFEVTEMDTLVNTFNFTILVTKADFFSNYDGRHNGYSRDQCVYLNQPMISQSQSKDDGELFCTYSEENKDPFLNFTQRIPKAGLILDPGERLLFQGSPRWGRQDNGTPRAFGFSNWVTYEVKRAENTNTGMRRVRFPRGDTGYQVNDGSLLIKAGNLTNKPSPAKVPPGFPQKNSNWWFPMTKSTKIYGVSIFLSQGLADGIQGVDACVRIVRQGGENLIDPLCITLSANRLGPTAFDQNFYNGGNSFYAFEDPIHAPAGALVGIDFKLRSPDAKSGMDFAGYLWFER